MTTEVNPKARLTLLCQPSQSGGRRTRVIVQGLHAERELEATERITGRLVEVITEVGRPGNASGEGFMAKDEDVIAVLKADNRLVGRLGFTHGRMARPLFHLWNLILKEYELNRFGRSWDNIQYVLYHENKVRFGMVHPTRGFQDSIFDDEIMGAFEISFYREVDGREQEFLRRKYPHLDEPQMAELTESLSHIHMGEMEPYYIMRYGFYEGHTGYRADPLAILPSSSASGAWRRSRLHFQANSTRSLRCASPGTICRRPPNHAAEFVDIGTQLCA